MARSTSVLAVEVALLVLLCDCADEALAVLVDPPEAVSNVLESNQSSAVAISEEIISVPTCAFACV